VSERDEKLPPRTVEPNRAQLRLLPVDLDRMLPDEHPARAVWDWVERLDLGQFYDVIRAREGSAGRPANDPKIYLALWIYATLDGVGSAREIERLTRDHLAYQWICGGVSVNHHSLSDFRNAAADRLKDLLRQSVVTLMTSGLVEIRRVSHDGMKVRASAGAGSFHTRGKLEKIAQQQVERLSAEIEDDSAPASRREKSARERADKQRSRRIERALEEMKEAEKRKKSNNGKKKTEARTSTTDPSARVMKMADGGFRPAHNVHLVTDTATTVIVAVDVNNDGTDLHAMVPLAEQIEQTYDRKPKEWLADGGCTSLGNIDAMAERGCKLYAPLRKRTNPNYEPTDERPTDSDAVREWRARMGTDEAKALYRQRGATAEWVNAQLRAQGLWRFLVRGIEKARAVVLMHALTHNMRRSWSIA